MWRAFAHRDVVHVMAHAQIEFVHVAMLVLRQF